METPVTIEQMILEGSCTAAWASNAGYKWDAQVVGGDALKKRMGWLALQARSTTFTGCERPPMAPGVPMQYAEWIAVVADRLIELGVPADEVNEEVIDFPWFLERYEDEALASVTADEYFHLLMNVGLEDSPVDTEPSVYNPEEPF